MVGEGDVYIYLNPIQGKDSLDPYVVLFVDCGYVIFRIGGEFIAVADDKKIQVAWFFLLVQLVLVRVMLFQCC